MSEIFSPYEDDPNFDPRSPQNSIKGVVKNNSTHRFYNGQERQLFQTLVESEFTPGEAIFIITRWRAARVFVETSK